MVLFCSGGPLCSCAPFIAIQLSRRAVFIDWATGLDHRAGAARPRFDIARFFRGPGHVDWAWSEHARSRLHARHGRGAALQVRWNASAPCAALWRLLDGSEAAVRLAFGDRTALGLLPLCVTTRAAAGEDRGTPPTLDALAEELPPEKFAAAALDWRLRRLQGGAAAARGAEAARPEASLWSAAAGMGRPTRAGRATRCLLHLLMSRPRAALRAALLPYLERAGDASHVVALHVRTGWADESVGVPLPLVAPTADGGAAEALLRQLLAPRPDVASTHSCAELRRAERSRLAACGLACRCIPTREAVFGAGLRELLLEERAARFDVRNLLLNASARYALLAEAGEAGKAVAASGLERCGAAPRAAPPTGRLAPLTFAVECAARLAQPGGVLYVSGDSPGLAATLLARFRARGVRAFGCLGPACSEPQHSGRLAPAARANGPAGGAAGAGVAVDLWLHGAADALVGAGSSSFLHWAGRSGNRVETPSVGRLLPVCGPLAAAGSALSGSTDPHPHGACAALRWLLLSPVAEAVGSGSRGGAMLAALEALRRRAGATEEGGRGPRAEGEHFGCVEVETLGRLFEPRAATAMCSAPQGAPAAAWQHAIRSGAFVPTPEQQKFSVYHPQKPPLCEEACVRRGAGTKRGSARVSSSGSTTLNSL